VVFTYLKVKSAKCLCLVPAVLGLVILVLVLRIWSCLHHWYLQSSFSVILLTNKLTPIKT